MEHLPVYFEVICKHLLNQLQEPVCSQQRVLVFLGRGSEVGHLWQKERGFGLGRTGMKHWDLRPESQIRETAEKVLGKTMYLSGSVATVWDMNKNELWDFKRRMIKLSKSPVIQPRLFEPQTTGLDLWGKNSMNHEKQTWRWRNCTWIRKSRRVGVCKFFMKVRLLRGQSRVALCCVAFTLALLWCDAPSLYYMRTTPSSFL